MEQIDIKLKEIAISDIPQIDLYMDQITSFFEEYFKDFKRSEKDTILTKTMINNYVKAKILTPVKNKKYNKTQIVLLILIYKLKQILSLEDIKFILDDFLKLLQLDFEKHSKLLFEVYTFFIEELSTQELSLSQLTNKIVNKEYENDELKQHENEINNLLFTLVNISQATIAKKRVEYLIDKGVTWKNK